MLGSKHHHQSGERRMPPVPEIVRKLVARYGRESGVLQSTAYGESNTRKEFVDPLFTALGWDVANVDQHTEGYKDVVNEYSLKVGGSHKAPDYAFRIGGTRTFFVEAKRPGVDITTDPAPAYQLRRYGWTANLPVSVLVNFRHLAVYDCGRRPKESDKPSVARTLLIAWDELIDRWDELSDLLGKHSVLQGSLDRYTTGASRRRGTSLVDDEFLQQMEQWRHDLAANFALRNKDLGVADLNEAVQQTIDRLVFLRIAEDRGIETYGRLKDALPGQGVYGRLVAIFQQADTRYNSGLFHFRNEAKVSGAPDLLTPGLQIDDRVLRGVIEAMYYPESPYEFSVLPADILGQVYEQFLGKVIRLTANHVARVEDKPEVKKAGGVYYTPTWVVDHIVEQTLGQMLDGKTPTEARRLRILDPACGSGSFLLGAYEHLLGWFAETYAKADPKVKAKAMFQDLAGEWRLTLAERKRILTSCIYGVDIDRQAVEVTKLSLMLKVLEGQSTETINQQMQMFHVDRVLPDLDRNIQCGNSLVGSDATTMLDLDQRDEDLLNPFDWPVAFAKIVDKGGFDAVVGNPPYDVLEKERGAASWPHAILRDYLPFSAEYVPALGGKLNLYRLFLIRSIGLTKPAGRFGMIVPLSLAADISTARTRHHVLTALEAPTLDCFPQKDSPQRRVFLRAKLSTVVVTGKRSRKPRSDKNPVVTHVYPANDLTDSHIDNEVTIADCALLDPETYPVPLTNHEEWDLCRRLHRLANVSRLGELTHSYVITRGEVNQTTYGSYIHPTATGNVLLLKGVEVGPFGQYTKLTQGHREWLDEHSLLADHAGKSKPFGRRIATQRITGVDDRQRLVAMIVESGAWFADSTNSIATSPTAVLSLEYLAGLLNSDLFQWRFRLTSTNNNVGTNELEGLPVFVPNLSTPTQRSKYEAVVAATERITLVKVSAPSSQSPSAIEKHERRLAAAWGRLNAAVYDLYGLSEQEQHLVANRLECLHGGEAAEDPPSE
jgi:hypothetical protein